MAEMPGSRSRAAKAFYAALAFIAVVLAIIKLASFGWSMMSAAQPAPLLSSHYEISGHVSAADTPGTAAGHHAD